MPPIVGSINILVLTVHPNLMTAEIQALLITGFTLLHFCFWYIYATTMSATIFDSLLLPLNTDHELPPNFLNDIHIFHSSMKLVSKFTFQLV